MKMQSILVALFGYVPVRMKEVRAGNNAGQAYPTLGEVGMCSF